MLSIFSAICPESWNLNLMKGVGRLAHGGLHTKCCILFILCGREVVKLLYAGTRSVPFSRIGYSGSQMTAIRNTTQLVLNRNEY
jgi:hypothetical protein